jgi:hypothetical protein
VIPKAIQQDGCTIKCLRNPISSRYDNLDANTRFKATQYSKRRRVEKWPKLEAALYEWTLRMERRITITSDILKEKAIFFFGKIPVYKGLEMPHLIVLLRAVNFFSIFLVNPLPNLFICLPFNLPSIRIKIHLNM